MGGWKRPALVAVLVLGLAAAACGDGGAGADGGADGGGGGDGGGSTAKVTIHDFAFDPNTLSGAAGETLSIEITNEDSAEHSFTLDDDSASQDFEGGESGTVEVTLPDEAGSLGWHCQYHPAMTGTIQVS